MSFAVLVGLRRLCACLLLFGVWLAPFSVNRGHAQDAQHVQLQLTASVAGAQLYELGQRPRPERRSLHLAGPLTLTIAGAVTLFVPYLVAVFADLLALGEDAAFADPAHGEPCMYCHSSHTVLIPVIGPLLAAGDPLDPFSKGVSIALGVTEAVGLVLLVSGLVWLLTGLPHGKPRRRSGLQFGMLAVPLPGGGMVGMRLASGSDAGPHS